MSDIFISYSRKDIAFAKILVQSIKDRGLDPWIDWEDIPPSADWLAEVYQAIESADTFVFIVSQFSAQSEVCGKEIAHALENHKRLIPVVVGEIDPHDLPPAIAALNWILFRATDDYQASFDRLLQAVQTDLAWVKAHTRLQVRGLEWERKGCDASFLLRGKDLRDGEAWLAQAGPGREPPATPLQTRYLLASRQHAARQQRLTLAAVSVALLLTALLAILAWGQRNVAVASDRSRATAQAQAEAAGATAVAESQVRATAQAQAEAAGATAVAESYVRATAQANAEIQRGQAVEQRNLALARQLGSQAELLRGQDPGLFQRSVLLGAESLKHAATLEGDRALRSDLAIMPELKARLRVRPHNINGSYWDIAGLALSPDGRWLAAGSLGSVVTIWDTSTWSERRIIAPSPVRTVAFSPDSQLLAAGFDAGARVWDVASGRELGSFGHGQIFSLAFAPTSDRLAATADGKTSVWDRGTAQTVYEVSGGGNVVRFSPDGQLAASAWVSNTVVWDAHTGKVLVDKPHTFRNRQARELALTLQSLAFSPDGQRIAVGEGSGAMIFPRVAINGDVSIFEATTGKDIASIPTPDEIVGLEFSPDGRQLAAGNADGNVYLWDASTGVQLRAFPAGSNVVSTLFLPQGRLAYINAFGAAHVLDSQDGTEIARLSTETHTPLSSLAAAPAAGLIAVGDENGNVWVWRLAGQTTVEAGVGPGIAVSAVAFTPDGRKLLVGAWDRTIRLVDNATGAVTTPITHTQRVLVARLSPDGRWAASGTQDGNVRAWEVSSGRELFQASVGAEVGDLQFSPDSRRLAASEGFWPREAWYIYQRRPDGHASAVYVWELPSGREVARLPHAGLANGLAWSPDARRLATAGEDALAHVWEVDAGRELFTVPHQNRVNLVAFSQDGRLGASAESCFAVDPMLGRPCAPFVKVWDAASGRMIWRSQMGGPWISNLFFSPDSRWLAASNEYLQGCPKGTCEFVAQVWDAAAGRAAGKMVHDNIITALAFSPDSRTIASGGSDGTLRLWDPATGSQSAHISGIGSPYMVAFSADGRSLAEGGYESGESYARVLPVQPSDLVQMACSRLTRNLTSEEWRQYLGDEPYRATCPELEAGPHDVSRPDGPSTGARISPDGVYVLYQSQAANLVCPASGGHKQIYLYDRAARRNSLISVSAGGQPANADAELVRVSADWRWILWSSAATNLADGVDADRSPAQLYLYDRSTGQQELISAGADGKAADGGVQDADATEDLRYIVFSSDASTLLPGITPGATSSAATRGRQIYLYDREDERLAVVSLTPDGRPGGGNSEYPRISSDGRFVAFLSAAPDLLAGRDPGSRRNVYAYDRTTGELALVTRTRDGQPIDDDSIWPDRITGNRWLAFNTGSQNLDVEPGAIDSRYHLYDMVTGQITRTHAFTHLPASSLDAAGSAGVWSADWDDETGWYSGTGSQVFWRDETTGARVLVSHGADGQPGDDFSQDAAITADGQTVIFTSLATDLVPGDTNTYADIFAWERGTGQIRRLSVGRDGRQADGDSSDPVASADGRYVAFVSEARNLVPLDQSEGKQVYLLDRTTGEIARVSEAPACTAAGK